MVRHMPIWMIEDISNGLVLTDTESHFSNLFEFSFPKCRVFLEIASMQCRALSSNFSEFSFQLNVLNLNKKRKLI